MVFFEVKNRENGLGIPVRYRVLIKKPTTTNVLKGVFDSPKTMRKLCLSTKFPHQEIRRSNSFKKLEGRYEDFV